MGEADVFDGRGNMILAKDLKVTHLDSGLEYTIEDVIEDDPKNVKIVLRLPEEPRIAPAGAESLIADAPQILGEKDLVPSPTLPGDMALAQKQAIPAPASGIPDDEEEVFIIDQEEFEKEYEVK